MFFYVTCTPNDKRKDPGDSVGGVDQNSSEYLTNLLNTIYIHELEVLYEPGMIKIFGTVTVQRIKCVEKNCIRMITKEDHTVTGISLSVGRKVR